MTEFTPDEIEKLSAVVGVIKAHPDCDKELQKLLSKPGANYTPWNPDGKGFYWVGMCGDVVHETGIPSQHLNCFASEETAKRAAADAKIRYLFWQWKEQNDPAPANQSSYRIDWNARYKCFGTQDAPTLSGLIYPFSSRKAAHKFLDDCKPYLDEYARAMGWMNDGD